MPFPVAAERVYAAERELRRALPQELRARLMRANGGEVTATPVLEAEQPDFDPHWNLHPVWDDSDRKRAARSTNHIVRETADARSWPGFPAGAVSIASNGTADRLILLPDSDDPAYWNHEDGATARVRIWWE